MSWRIGCVENTVKITTAIIRDLMALENIAFTYQWSSFDTDWSDPPHHGGYLVFNSDHFEHMDFLKEPEVRAVLKKHKVKGKIRFASVEGDNRGEKWSYIFDGKGGCKRTRGMI